MYRHKNIPLFLLVVNTRVGHTRAFFSPWSKTRNNYKKLTDGTVKILVAFRHEIQNRLSQYEIWGSHSGENDNVVLLGHDTMQTHIWIQMFWRNKLSLSPYFKGLFSASPTFFPSHLCNSIWCTK
jgi:hypothetical protein